MELISDSAPGIRPGTACEFENLLNSDTLYCMSNIKFVKPVNG